MAFIHPRPSYDPHILIVPTTPFAALVTPGMKVEDQSLRLWEMIELARAVIAVTPGVGWQMIVNGGIRQDVGQVHGHLVHAQEILPVNSVVEVADPSAGLVPWIALFDELTPAASRPDNGYSLIFDLATDGPVAAWITESRPA